MSSLRNYQDLANHHNSFIHLIYTKHFSTSLPHPCLHTCHVAYFILMLMCYCILYEYSYAHLVGHSLSHRSTVCVAHLFSRILHVF